MSILPQPFQHFLGQVANAVSCHFLPGSCLLCQATSHGELLCPNCQRDLPLLDEMRCPRCASDSAQGLVCIHCHVEPPHFDQTIAVFRYEFPVDRLIKALKYQHQLVIAPLLGKTLAQHPSLKEANIDQIVALPLHPERIRERGFNQSIEIARPISQQLGRPILFDAVVRSKATLRQAGLSFKERHANVLGAFECGIDLNGQHLLLVDDVMTTGATLNECAHVLKLHGAARVTVAVAARALLPA